MKRCDVGRFTMAASGAGSDVNAGGQDHTKQSQEALEILEMICKGFAAEEDYGAPRLAAYTTNPSTIFYHATTTDGVTIIKDDVATEGSSAETLTLHVQKHGLVVQSFGKHHVEMSGRLFAFYDWAGVYRPQNLPGPLADKASRILGLPSEGAHDGFFAPRELVAAINAQSDGIDSRTAISNLLRSTDPRVRLLLTDNSGSGDCLLYSLMVSTGWWDESPEALLRWLAFSGSWGNYLLQMPKIKLLSGSEEVPWAREADAAHLQTDPLEGTYDDSFFFTKSMHEQDERL